ncbi:MAG TPA: PadR family transcriptional regulator [Vicinamibacteria bacterium]|nr:PadR family transcriptional regulator [Vicinamibacteria bacterium]
MPALVTARAALLQTLAFPGYGIELIDRVSRATGGLVRLRMGSIYPALRALEDEGLVRCQTIPPAGSAGRPRKYYELTPAGVATAHREREALAGLLRTRRSDPTAQDVLRMRERLRRSASVSAAARTLRGRLLARRRLT